ncbi:hypothetical protein SPHINGO8AM_40112 [Sphingomonas sp. 8AM]|nr:hypothetical protein SPHINGO8AM_40112 [Sphingomonas sp. 8AM]
MLAVHAMVSFNETVREMREMIYRWRRPLRLLDSKSRRALGEVPATSPDVALRSSLHGPSRVRLRIKPLGHSRLGDERRSGLRQSNNERVADPRSSRHSAACL